MEHSTSKSISFLLLLALLFSALIISHSTRFPNPYHPNKGVIYLNFLFWFFFFLVQNNICLILFSFFFFFCLSEHYKNEGGHGEVISRWLVSKRSARESQFTPPSPEANTNPPGGPWDVHAMKGGIIWKPMQLLTCIVSLWSLLSVQLLLVHLFHFSLLRYIFNGSSGAG